MGVHFGHFIILNKFKQLSCFTNCYKSVVKGKNLNHIFIGPHPSSMTKSAKVSFWGRDASAKSKNLEKNLLQKRHNFSPGEVLPIELVGFNEKCCECREGVKARRWQLPTPLVRFVPQWKVGWGNWLLLHLPGESVEGVRVDCVDLVVVQRQTDHLTITDNHTSESIWIS